MIKNEKHTIDKLSQYFSERDISILGRLFNYLKIEEHSSLSHEEIDRDIRILKTITQLKQDKKYYAFHIEDTWAQYTSGYGSGVDVYRRQGDNLADIISHTGGDEVPEIDEVIKYLHKHNISRVYTGRVPDSGFLGIKSFNDDEGDSVTYSELNETEKQEFELGNIKVITLDKLL